MIYEIDNMEEGWDLTMGSVRKVMGDEMQGRWIENEQELLVRGEE